MNNHLIPGTTEYHEAIRKIEESIGRKLTDVELSYLRKQSKRKRPRTGQGKTHTRSYWPGKGDKPLGKV